MIGATLAVLLALASGVVLAAGLVAVIRLMVRISEAMTSIRILVETVVGATEDVNTYVRGIGSNVSGILEEAEGIADFINSLPADPLLANGRDSALATNPAGLSPQKLT